jgi:hypothetical protein
VVCGEIVEASACETALGVSEKLVAITKADAGHSNENGLISAQAFFRQFPILTIRCLLAQVRQEMAKVTLGNLHKEPALPQSPTGSVNGSRGQLVGDDPPYVFRFDGHFWQVRFGGGSTLRPFPNHKGMQHIHTLLSNRDRDLTALQVLHFREPGRTNQRSIVSRERGSTAPAVAKPQDLFDEEALAQFKDRLSKLGEKIEDAKQFGNEAEQEKLERERIDLLNQIKKGQGLGGRTRRLDVSPGEKARTTVTHSLERAFALLEKGGMVELVAHLESAIATGKECIYRPDSDFPEWAL